MKLKSFCGLHKKCSYFWFFNLEPFDEKRFSTPLPFKQNHDSKDESFLKKTNRPVSCSSGQFFL